MTVTNRWGPGVALPMPDVEVRAAWLTAVHAALRVSTPRGEVVGEVREPGPGHNYFSVRITMGGQPRQRLLLNVPALLVACAWDESSGLNGPLDFCPVPSSSTFITAGFEVASESDLSRDLHTDDVRALTVDEQRDIAYHRPHTVGDVLFNWFD